MGPFRALLGASVGSLQVHAGGQVDLDGLDRSTDPLQVSGRVDAGVHDIAVAAAGKIVAVVPAAKGRFWALVPQETAGRGLVLYAIDGPTSLLRLR